MVNELENKDTEEAATTEPSVVEQTQTDETPEPAAEPVPEATEQAPEVTASTPEATEQAPEAAEQAPEATEQAPEAAEQAPEAAEQAPEAAEQAPEAAEQAPEATAPAPEATEMAPEVTASAAEQPAAASETTAEDPQASTDIDFGAILEQFEQEQTVFHSGELVEGTRRGHFRSRRAGRFWLQVRRHCAGRGIHRTRRRAYRKGRR